MVEPPASTRDRVVDAAMRLFGERGYAATSVADIEAAAGLSPGSGSLYRHFASKEALLMEGVRRRVADGVALRAALQSPPTSPPDGLAADARLVVRAGLERLEQEKDLNRLITKDLRQFPAALELAREEEIGAVHRAVAGWLQARARHPLDPERAAAMATVVVGATAHFWILGDVFDGHPSGVDTDAFVEALVSMVAAWLERPEPVT
jgi:AcrR family transcriptional regulator